MFFTFVLTALGVSATQLCLPLTHQGWVSTTRWLKMNTMTHMFTYDEYNEGDFMYIWSDGTTRKTLAHVFEREVLAGRSYEEHTFFSLRDYTKKYHWYGHYNFTTQTTSECWLELFEPDHRPWGPYCLAKDAKMRGQGTIGEKNKVDFYEETVSDPYGAWTVEVDTLMETGTTDTPVQERIDGTYYNAATKEQWYFAEHREWFDFSTAPIPASRFAIPAGCPNP